MNGPTHQTAWDQANGEFVVIKPGEAETLRPLCQQARLVCPISDCPEPAITTRKGYSNRWGTFVTDGFRHLVAPTDGNHTPETLRHIDGKAAVRDWLKALGFRSVSLERNIRTGHHPTTRQAAYRRPDVTGHHPNGRRMAFEIQVSPLNADLWQQRTIDMERRGWHVTWLWAWPNPDSQPLHTTALRTALTRHPEVWFVDPYTPEGPSLGWGWQPETIATETFHQPPRHPAGPVHYDWHPLNNLLISSTGQILRPGNELEHERLAIARHRQQTEEQEAALAEQQARERTAQRQTELRRQNQAAAAKQVAEQQERQARAARSDTGHPIPQMDATIEQVARTENPPDDRIWMPVTQWKRPVIHRLLTRPADHPTVTIHQIVDYVEHNFPCNSGAARPAVDRLLTDLARTGTISVTDTTVTVQPKTTTNPPPEPTNLSGT